MLYPSYVLLLWWSKFVKKICCDFTILFLLLWKCSKPVFKVSLLISFPHFQNCQHRHILLPGRTAVGIAPIIFSICLLLIFYQSLRNSCSDTFDEDSFIFCCLRPLWYSASWPVLLTACIRLFHLCVFITYIVVKILTQLHYSVPIWSTLTSNLAT